VVDPKKRTVVLGLVFVLLLVVAYVENGSFFGTVGDVFLIRRWLYFLSLSIMFWLFLLFCLG